MNSLFVSSFFYKFTAPNANRIISLMKKEVLVDNKMNWSNKCIVDTISLKWENWKEVLSPTLDVFSSITGHSNGYNVSDPWINIYSLNGFQEIHDHIENGIDFSAVFFMNVGKDFGNFYFYDRLGCTLTPKVRNLFGYEPSWRPVVNEGDFLIFPSHVLHGVSPHKSNTLRKTLSFNFSLN